MEPHIVTLYVLRPNGCGPHVYAAKTEEQVREHMAATDQNEPYYLIDEVQAVRVGRGRYKPLGIPTYYVD